MQGNCSKRTGALSGARPTAAAPFAYVANKGSNTVSVIDTAANPPAVVTPVPVGTIPVGVAVTPDGTHVYVANLGSNTVSVIDTASNAVVATVQVESAPNAVAITPDGTHAYVTNNGNVSVIAKPPPTQWWPRSQWGWAPMG
jgi:YVTN family beta-propeller protein